MDRSDVAAYGTLALGGALSACYLHKFPIAGVCTLVAALPLTSMAIRAERSRANAPVSTLLSGSVSVLFIGATASAALSGLSSLKTAFQTRSFRSGIWGVLKLGVSPLGLPVSALFFNVSRGLWQREWWPCEMRGWQEGEWIFLPLTNEKRARLCEEPWHERHRFRQKMRTTLIGQEDRSDNLSGLAQSGWKWKRFWKTQEHLVSNTCKWDLKAISKTIEALEKKKSFTGREAEEALKEIHRLGRAFYPIKGDFNHLCELETAVNELTLWEGQAAINQFLEAFKKIEPMRGFSERMVALCEKIAPHEPDVLLDFLCHALRSVPYYTPGELADWNQRLGLEGNPSNCTLFWSALRNKLLDVGLYSPIHIRMNGIVPEGWQPDESGVIPDDYDPSEDEARYDLGGKTLTGYVLDRLVQYINELDQLS